MRRVGEVTVKTQGPTVGGDVLLELGVSGNREIKSGADHLVGGQVSEDNRLHTRTDSAHGGVLENWVSEEGVLTANHGVEQVGTVAVLQFAHGTESGGVHHPAHAGETTSSTVKAVSQGDEVVSGERGGGGSHAGTSSVHDTGGLDSSSSGGEQGVRVVAQAVTGGLSDGRFKVEASVGDEFVRNRNQTTNFVGGQEDA